MLIHAWFIVFFTSMLLNGCWIVNHLQIRMKNHQVCIPAKAQVVLASVLFVISIYDMGIMYDNVMAAQENKKDGYVTNCSGFGILATDRIYENQVFDIGETIRITYEITENAEVDYRLDVSNANGIDASVAVNDSDTNVTKGFFVDFSVEQEGVGEITVDLYSNNSENEKIGRVNIYTYTENGLVFVDGASSLYAEERYYGYLLEIGDIDLEEYEEKIEDMYRITDEDAIVEMEVTTSNVRATSGNITVSGVIKWTDTAGVTHPANEIRVEIMDEDVASDDLIKAVYTDSNGKYTATFANDTSLTEGGYDIFVRVYARGRYVQVTNKSGGLYNFSREVCSDANGGTSYSVNFTLGNTNNAYRSIHVQQAVSMASNYVYQQEGSYLDTVYVRYPDDTQGTTCYTDSSNRIYVLADDYCDWDVLQHEYGHHVSNEFGFDKSPGGEHSYSYNLADKYLNKETGIYLAWSEGWATFFAISLQNKLGANSLNIPNVGDVKYTDTLDQSIDMSIESCNTTLGEANELVVSATLFDMADGGTGESWDSMYLGYSGVYNLVVDNKCHRFKFFY